LPRIFNLAEFTGYESVPFQDTVYASIFHQQEVEGTYFAIDKNRNQDFLDDEVTPIVENIPVRYELPVSGVLNGNEESEYKIPLKLEYKSGRKGLLITSLLKYDIEYSFADTALRVVLNVGTYYPNFTIETPKVGTDELVKKNFLLKEPFFFMERYWVLQNLDIKNHTIELIRFPKGIKPKGYKQGYYVDVDSLFADHGIPEEVQNRTDSSLFLLYFWGTWCHPCVKNMPKTNKLGQLAKGTDRLSMFGVALMSRGQVEQDIREFEKEYTLTFPSFVESFEAPHHFIRKLLNMRYPSYYLLNNKGRIIYKGENTPELWRALEKHGNIRKE
jgi:thiol-disulfide isomerase/thioredoxin